MNTHTITIFSDSFDDSPILTPQQLHTRYLERLEAEHSLPHKATLRAEARKAGAETFAIPLCGGGFTDHHINTETGRCVECKKIQNKAWKKNNHNQSVKDEHHNETTQ